MWWHYENLEPGAPYDWSPAVRGESEFDTIDFHLDIGCGKLKKGRIGIDKYPADGVDLCIDLETLSPTELEQQDGSSHRHEFTVEHYRDQGALVPRHRKVLPFPTDSIESIISHHCLEHVGDGFIRVMDECYRVLKPGGIMRIIVPLFPSLSAVEDPDHRRYFMTGTFEAFCGAPTGESWLESFSVPYTKARFEMVDKDYTRRLDDPEEWWGHDDRREIRVALRKYSEEALHAVPGDGDIQKGRGDAEGAALDDADGAAEARGDRELAGVA